MDSDATQGFFAASAMWIGIIIVCIITGCIKSKTKEDYTDTRLTVEFKAKSGDNAMIDSMKKWVYTAPCISNEWTTTSVRNAGSKLTMEFFKEKKMP